MFGKRKQESSPPVWREGEQDAIRQCLRDAAENAERRLGCAAQALEKGHRLVAEAKAQGLTPQDDEAQPTVRRLEKLRELLVGESIVAASSTVLIQVAQEWLAAPEPATFTWAARVLSIAEAMPPGPYTALGMDNVALAGLCVECVDAAAECCHSEVSAALVADSAHKLSQAMHKAFGSVEEAEDMGTPPGFLPLRSLGNAAMRKRIEEQNGDVDEHGDLDLG